MAEDFAGKVAIVTGGGNGIGAATCRAFAAAGRLCRGRRSRRRRRPQRYAGEIAGNRGNAAAYPLDVTDRVGFAAIAAEVATKAGGVDILVNGAGVTIRRMIGEMGAEDWDRVIAVNLTGAFNGIQAVLPHLRARGGGAIVNIASIAGLRISFGGTANYSRVKGRAVGIDPPCRLRTRPRPYPRQRGLPGSNRHRVWRLDADRRKQSQARPAKSRLAGCASPRTSPTRSCSSPATRPA